jgi:predicted phosphodiesterase
MRYAIISDLHANIEALDATLARIDALGVDRVLCLGDIVGYNADPEPCIERLRERKIRSLAGNHDRAVVGTRSALHFGSQARRVVEWTRHQLSDQSRAYLARLPIADSIDGAFFAVHAALHPEPNDELHLSTKERVRASLLALASGRFGARVCFFGHTHRAVVHSLSGTHVQSRDVDTETTLELDPELFHIVNPGSVGQSRDGDPRAAFAVYDSDASAVSFHRVAYDFALCHDKAERAGLFDREPAHVRGSVWISARVDEGAKLLRRAFERVL